MSKAFNQPEPVVQPVVVSPAKPPPASAVDNTQQFFEPQPTDRPPLTNNNQPTDWPLFISTLPTGLSLKTSHRPGLQTGSYYISYGGYPQRSDSGMDTSSDSDSDLAMHPQFTGQAEEGELSNLEQDISLTDTDQAASEEQN